MGEAVPAWLGSWRSRLEGVGRRDVAKSPGDNIRPQKLLAPAY